MSTKNKSTWRYAPEAKDNFLSYKRGSISSARFHDALSRDAGARLYMVYENRTKRIIGRFIFFRSAKRAFIELSNTDIGGILASYRTPAKSAAEAFGQIRFSLEMPQ